MAAERPSVGRRRGLAAALSVAASLPRSLSLFDPAAPQNPTIRHASLGLFVALQSGPHSVRPMQVLAVIFAAACVMIMWWVRERRVTHQHAVTRTLNKLAEEILEAVTPADIARRLNAVLPPLRGITAVRLYVHDTAASALRPVAPQAGGISAPGAFSTEGAALCFGNRPLIAIPDT